MWIGALPCALKWLLRDSLTAPKGSPSHSRQLNHELMPPLRNSIFAFSGGALGAPIYSRRFTKQHAYLRCLAYDFAKYAGLAWRPSHHLEARPEN